jgi:hypothetical protein
MVESLLPMRLTKRGRVPASPYSFSRVTPVLLNCGIRQDSRSRFNLAAVSTRKEGTLKNPRVPEHL